MILTVKQTKWLLGVKKGSSIGSELNVAVVGDHCSFMTNGHVLHFIGDPKLHAGNTPIDKVVFLDNSVWSMIPGNFKRSIMCFDASVRIYDNFDIESHDGTQKMSFLNGTTVRHKLVSRDGLFNSMKFADEVYVDTSFYGESVNIKAVIDGVNCFAVIMEMRD